MSLISVIITVYNGEKYLAAAIDSVQAQTTTDWELVIVDDGSTDESLSVAHQYSTQDRRIRVVHQANGGVAAARNRGFREADISSNYVIFLDQDDVWEKDALEVLVSALERKPQAVGAHGLVQAINADGRYQEGKSRLFDELYNKRRGIVDNVPIVWPSDQATTFSVLVLSNVILTPGQLLIRRSALAAAGVFDSAVVPSEDWDMWLRLSLYGDILFVNRIVLNYRTHESNATRHIQAMAQAETRVYQKLASSPVLTDEQRRIASLGCRWFRWDKSVLYLHYAWARLTQRQWLHAVILLRHSLLKLAFFISRRLGVEGFLLRSLNK